MLKLLRENTFVFTQQISFQYVIHIFEVIYLRLSANQTYLHQLQSNYMNRFWFLIIVHCIELYRIYNTPL